ncbi:D-2-hydroxyacid dehydrogenase [Janthinobacterium fluminis]|uniref:D-2-hydroxyacid dehydrogenase n=1 Tax=Janthinobacterium fluminis TaxID=2987524 RepID=A0ABT5JZK7_9BURK|nr:D-2-hydroxyacid dehydrogenase [Janthinobacterium fluminis]MDC8758165.1 D-2-hydroxyacid dehydrogenase [Janthinobacterium fluminis]
MNTPHDIVFLDRDSVIATLRPPRCPHTWRDYPGTAAADVVARLAGASIAISNKVPLRAAELAQLPALRMIAVAATGTDAIDLAACRSRGIVVSNVRDYAVASVPEHCMALMLALRRKLLDYRADVEAGLWQRSARFCLLNHPIRDLHGSRLGLLGYGALGKSVAKLGRAFGMEVVAHTRSPLADPDVTAVSWDELLATSDVLSLHAPLNAQTRHIIGAAELARMRPSALLINTARGGLVDEAALAAALTNGVIGGAGFDVLAQEPPPADNVLLNLRLPNFILTPHTAWASGQAMQALADQLIDNVEAFAAGRPRNVVA